MALESSYEILLAYGFRGIPLMNFPPVQRYPDSFLLELHNGVLQHIFCTSPTGAKEDLVRDSGSAGQVVMQCLVEFATRMDLQPKYVTKVALCMALINKPTLR
jgi:hypothetical protein